MTIKCIDTYDRAVVEPLGVFSNESAMFDDRANFSNLPPAVAEQMKEHVANGRLPSTRQPEDGIVWTDTECIITMVWLDYPSAIIYSNGKLTAGQKLGIKSSVVVEED
jgi:hypothetical protein